jgi:hypothetical protein
MTIEQPARTGRGARLLVASLGLLITLAGQLTLYLTPEGHTRGVVVGLVLSVVGVLTLLAGLLGRSPAWASRPATRVRISTRAALVVVAVMLAIMTAGAQVAFLQLDRTNYLPVLLLWLTSAAVYAAALVEQAPKRSDVRTWLRAHQQELILLGLVTLLAGGLRFYRLGSLPRVIDGDEGRIGQAALATQSNPLANPFALFENFGGIYIQAIGLAVSTLGATPFALRLVPAGVGTLAIPAIYLLGRALLGPRGALLAALLLAISHAHLHFSRIVAVAYIAETLLIPLELYFFYTGLRARQGWRMAVGGLILGAHFSVYVSAQIIFVLLLVYLAVAWLVTRPLVRGAGRLVAAFWLGVLITALPQAVYAVRHPDNFFARMNLDGTFQSGWLEREVASTGQSALTILAGRVTHAFLVLNHLPSVDFYGARIPVLDLITGSLFLIGLVYSLCYTRDSRRLLLNGYFWSLLLAIGIFAIPPTADSYRMLVALPAVILLAALGLEQILPLLSLAGTERQGARRVVLSALLAAVLVLNWRAYFVDFGMRCRYGMDRATRFASYMGNYLKAVDEETTVYLLSDEELRYGTHVSADFLSGGNPVTNWTDPVEALVPNANTVVLAGPSRHEELRVWARAQATGEVTGITDCEQPMLLVYEATVQ